MDTLHITTAAELISLIDYWPHESLVCNALTHRAVTPEFTADVETHFKALASQGLAQRTAEARGPRSRLIDDGEEPTAAHPAEVLARLLVHRLIADMPGLDLQMDLLLFGESRTAPERGPDRHRRRTTAAALRRDAT